MCLVLLTAWLRLRNENCVADLLLQVKVLSSIRLWPPNPLLLRLLKVSAGAILTDATQAESCCCCSASENSNL